jgi:opacity protein-like surface antigen
MNCQDKIDAIATATGRLGYAVGRVLYYGKAGAAWTRDNFTASCNLGPQNFTTVAFTPTAPAQLCANPAGFGAHIVGLTIQGSNGFSASDDRVGWTAGFGTEFGLTPNWSAKAELDYIDFGNRSLVATDGSQVNAGLRVVEAKIGLNYHFAQ